MTGEQAAASAAAVAAFSAGAARGHQAAACQRRSNLGCDTALELAELDAALDAAAWHVFEARAVVR
ncbi:MULTISPECIES: hypothetical protein [Nocardia]|uniref:hypothetical protein n=1 Tax=Nocardia TaxID=1817 RepID=UPI00135C6FAE|nr:MULTISPECIES: hypothetical protein [Nocardia]